MDVFSEKSRWVASKYSTVVYIHSDMCPKLGGAKVPVEEASLQWRARIKPFAKYFFLDLERVPKLAVPVQYSDYTQAGIMFERS